MRFGPVYLVAGVPLVLLFLLLAFLALNSNECTITGVEDVRSRIERELPLGSSAEQIQQWISDNDIEMRGSGPARNLISWQRRMVPPESSVVVAFLDSTGNIGLFNEKSILIIFLLDEDDRLADVIIEEKTTGL